MASIVTLEAPPCEEPEIMAGRSNRGKKKKENQVQASDEMNERAHMSSLRVGEGGDRDQSGAPETVNNEANSEPTSGENDRGIDKASTNNTDNPKTSNKRKAKAQTKRLTPKASTSVLKTQHELQLYIETWYEKAKFGLPVDVPTLQAQLNELLDINVPLIANGYVTEEVQIRMDKARVEVA